MSSGSAGHRQDRFDHLVEMKQDLFGYGPFREAIAAELEADEQFRALLVLSEQSRQFTAARESQVGCNDPMWTFIADFREGINKALHRRADEVITELCASCVRQDDRWMVEDSDSMDSTEIQAAFDGIEEALWWLDDHEEIVERLGITYPEDKW